MPDKPENTDTNAKTARKERKHRRIEVKKLQAALKDKSKLWQAADKKTADADTIYTLDMKGVSVPQKISELYWTKLIRKPNVRFIVYNDDDYVALQVMISINSPSVKAVHRVKRIHEEQEKTDVTVVNIANRERADRVMENFFYIQGDTCTIEYPDMVEVDVDMLQVLDEAIYQASLDKRFADVAQFILALDIMQINRDARIALYDILNAASTMDKYNGKQVAIDFDRITNKNIRTDISNLLHTRNYQATRQEREMIWSKVRKGTVGRLIGYNARTDGQGNKNNVAIREESEILISRIAIFRGVQESSSGTVVLLDSLNADRENMQSLLPEEFAEKFRGVKEQPPARIISTSFSVGEIGYDTEFLGEFFDFKRFDPYSVEPTILHGEQVVVSDALYAQMLLDAYGIDYNREELELDIRRAEDAGVKTMSWTEFTKHMEALNSSRQ